jgi:hypothetical protein
VSFINDGARPRKVKATGRTLGVAVWILRVMVDVPRVVPHVRAVDRERVIQLEQVISAAVLGDWSADKVQG